MKKLRTLDPVIVIAGKHKGKISTIESFAEGDKVYVKGVNEVKRAKKWEWFITKTLPLHISNIMYYSEKDAKATRVAITITKGKKTRVLQTSGAKIS